MASTKQPISQNEMHGVYTAGNPTGRPSATAAKCEDFRVMPGFWLRLRGGRRAQSLIPSMGECLQIHPLRVAGTVGSPTQLVQIKYGAAVVWDELTLLTYGLMPGSTGIEPISLAYDGSWSATRPAAVCNLYDRSLFYNGLGVRATESKPPFSTFSGHSRFFGLDAFCVSTRPTVAFAAGAGDNIVASRVRIYTGLYNASTDHYSNAVYCGEVTDTALATGTITVSNLDRLTYATHGASETGELYRVFYATLDGPAYSVPYLILDSAYTGPLKVAATATTASLSVVGGFVNGWALDVTKEAPYANHPPRPMRSIAFVNGRIYGVPLAGGSGSAVGMPTIFDPTQVRSDFTYVPTDLDVTGVVWSNSYSDNYSQSHPGDPLQCWPLTNFAATPNGDTPVIVAPSQDAQRVFVGTPRSCYFLSEVADGLHEYYSISEIHGITNPATFINTRYGQTWIDQRGQLVLLPIGSAEVQVLSHNYQSLFTGTARCCAYIYDPLHQIDRVEVFLSDGTSICHEFGIGGEAMTCTNRDFTTAKTVVDPYDKQHHVLAKYGFFTQEAQPSTGLIPTQDEAYMRVTDAAISGSSTTLASATAAFVAGDVGKSIAVAGAGTAGAVLQSTIATRISGTQVTLNDAAATTVTGAVCQFARVVASDINGEYIRNWDSFGDPTNRKVLDHVAVVADAEISAALDDNPLQVDAYYDFEEVTSANVKQADVRKTPQSATDSAFQAVLANANAFRYKFVYRLRGHAADDASFLNHVHPGTQGDLAKNFYGCICELFFQFKQTVNRP